MPSYNLTHTHKFGHDTIRIETDQALPLGMPVNYNQNTPGDGDRAFQALLDHLRVNFEPNLEESLEIEEVNENDTVKLNIADLPLTGPVVSKYDDLLALAQHYDNQWALGEGIDWEQAEDLVRDLNQMTPEDKALCPGIAEILTYTAENDEWDCGEVARFRQIIECDLKAQWPVS